MPKPKLNIIRPSTGFVQMTESDLLLRLNAVHDGIKDNPAYPNPPVDIAGFKAVIDRYTTAAAFAALDGGKTAIIARDKCRTDAIVMLRLLAHYVETACKNDMKTFVSSGFVASSTGQRTPPQPVSTPSVVRVDHGQSGQLVVTIRCVDNARIYEVRYAPVPADGATVNWTTIMVTSTRPPAVFDNLRPGGIYTFQVRAFGKLGFSDWSSSVERMCV